jgi:hypothetical protein
MNRTLLIFILLLSSSQLIGQLGFFLPLGPRSHSFNLNFPGNASLVSINYENRRHFSDEAYLTSSVGFGYDRVSDINSISGKKKYFTIPHYASITIGKKIHKVELGFGGTILTSSDDANYAYYSIIAYRLEFENHEGPSIRIFTHFPFNGYLSDLVTGGSNRKGFSLLGVSAGINL